MMRLLFWAQVLAFGWLALEIVLSIRDARRRARLEAKRHMPFIPPKRTGRHREEGTDGTL